MAQTDSNLMERLKRAVYPSDPNSPDGDWALRINGGNGGTSTTDNSTFTPGASSITPIGGYQGGRQVASGHVAAAAINGSGVLQVDMVSGITLAVNEGSAVIPIVMTQTTSKVGSGNTVILNGNNNRKYFLFVNDSDTIIYLSSNGIATPNFGVRLNGSGGSYEMPADKFIPTGTISAIVLAGTTKNLLVSEGT